MVMIFLFYFEKGLGVWLQLLKIHFFWMKLLKVYGYFLLEG